MPSTPTKARVLNFTSCLSAAVFFLLIVAWLLASGVDSRRQFLRLSRGCHLSIDAWGADARLEIFNNASYGPYRGSIVDIIAGRPSSVQMIGFGDQAGIYYRWIHWPSGQTTWTISLSLLYPLLAASVLPIIWSARRLRGNRRGFPVSATGASIE